MLFLILLAASHLPTKVGNVDFTKPCSYLFDKKDMTYLPNGSFKVKKVKVWNPQPTESKPFVNGIIGEMPPAPKNAPEADMSYPLRVYLDARFCKPKGNMAVCKNVTFSPTAIKPKEIK